MLSPRRVVLVAACLAFVPASLVLAQSNQEINAGVQFSFAPPGARSMALGGAFLGLADDATAAYANPAGLTTGTWRSATKVPSRMVSWDWVARMPRVSHVSSMR